MRGDCITSKTREGGCGNTFISAQKNMSYEEKNNNPTVVPNENTPMHTLKLEGRRRVSLTGVKDVDGFDEHTVILVTTQGMMSIYGEDLHITKLNVDEGVLCVDGRINALQYSDGENKGKNVLGKLFR